MAREGTFKPNLGIQGIFHQYPLPRQKFGDADFPGVSGNNVEMQMVNRRAGGPVPYYSPR